MNELDTWWPARRRLAALAIGSAFLTGLVIALVGGGRVQLLQVGLYLMVTIGAIRIAALVTGQVLVGMLLNAAALLSTDTVGGLMLAVAVGGVLMTAELLAAVARLDAPIERDPGPVVRPSAMFGVVGAVVYAAVLLASSTDQFDSLIGFLVASGAIALLAVLLLSGVRSRISRRGQTN